MIRKSLCVALCLLLLPFAATAQGDRGAVIQLCDAFPTFQSELNAFITAYVTGRAGFDDLDGDGLPEIASLSIIDFSACDRNQEQLVGLENLGAETQIAYNNNQLALSMETDFAMLARYQNVLAAL